MKQVLELKEAIAGMIRRTNYVTFAEIESRLGQSFNLKGDLAIEFAEHPNCFLWFNMSSVFVEAVNLLRTSKEFEVEHCPELIYLIDGIYPNVPVVKRLTEKGYKKEHWLPIVFRRAE